MSYRILSKRNLGVLVGAVGIGASMLVTAAPAHAQSMFWIYASGISIGENCAPTNANYNIAPLSGPLGAFAAQNGCIFRLWLHQYNNWQNHGWSYCINPNSSANIPARYSNPQNAYLSSNTARC